MHKSILVTFIAISFVTAAFTQEKSDRNDDTSGEAGRPPVKRVVLYKNGMG